MTGQPEPPPGTTPFAAIVHVSLDGDGRGIAISDTRAEGSSALDGSPEVRCRFDKAPPEVTQTFYALAVYVAAFNRC